MRIDARVLQSIILEALVNAYQVLGVPKGASDEEIKKAWRALAAANHPDKGGSKDKIVAVNASKQRLDDKVALFRYGANVNLNIDEKEIPADWLVGNGSPSASPGASSGGSSSGSAWDDFWRRGPSPGPQPGPKMKECPWCHRNVSVQNNSGSVFGDRFVNHYTAPGGPTKCEGSGKRPTAYGAGSPPPGSNSSSSSGPSAGGSSWGNSNGSTSGYSGAGRDKRYFTFVKDRSRKFWEIELVDNNSLRVTYGRIGTSGQSRTKKYGNYRQASLSMRRMIRNKLDKGYIEQREPAPRGPAGGAPRPAGSAGAPGAPPRQRASHGNPNKETYKVYPWKGARRVVRVGGKLFGTEQGGNLKDGGHTKFNANDRVKVSAKDGRMHVGSTTSDHSQTWDPIDEVRQVVDELVLEMIVRIGESL